ncbi:putative Holliday junction resolvase [[Clostridium] ultunense Esp]|uniref:Putative pre-16S rRNA nuclease n=1 Tax=[Clostridium] ultunense Esp TaxID=1288971 RepID=M1ZFR7_9FIRM|nr:Holliday junction resolvase RuvX [Schnuerera ultunensis]CCQ97586.1 putative Holliday junction resolvase [[Clostridium] ultunense Esp]SHD77212.1 pre-16S ribosomal RNA maturation enzyme [[Clostridium] ultunense Esp]
MKRIMGLDVGDKTIGVAVSDPLLLTAQGLKTIARESNKKDIKKIQDIIEEYNISKIVVGLPKNMNNTLGSQGEKVLDFVEKLKRKINIEIILEDERLTTVSAERILLEGDVSRKDRKKIIDKVAASYILQNYLDRR